MIRISVLLGLLGIMPAYAADTSLPVNDYTQPVLETDQVNWSGIGLGIFGGISTSTGKATLGDFQGVLLPLDVTNGLFPYSISEQKSGINGGVSIGYDYHDGNFLAGVEADFTLQDLQLSHRFSRVDPNPNAPFTGIDTNTAYETRFGNLATLRLRAGLTHGDLLVYGTAGIAAGHVTNRFKLDLPDLGYSSPDWSNSGVRNGYAAGAGLEYKITSNISMKLEGLYVDLADTTIKAVDPVTFPGETISYKFKNDVLLGKIGLSFKF